MITVKEDDVVFCKVKKIEGTTVFLEIEECSLEGSMVLSEVAAGRIRNLRQYVSPNRRVVCKVLRIAPDHVELSLRRVTTKEREHAFERFRRETALSHVLRVIGENPEKIISKIKEEYDIFDFVETVKEQPKILEQFLPADKIGKITQILTEKEGKKKTVLKNFFLHSNSEQGLKDIQQILDMQNVEFHYLGSSKFSILVEGKDFKEANLKLESTLKEIEKRAKEKKAVFEMRK